MNVVKSPIVEPLNVNTDQLTDFVLDCNLNDIEKIENPNLLPVEMVANRIVELKKKYRPDLVEKELLQKYINLEKELRELNISVPNWDDFPLTGGLKWSMSWNEAQSYVLQKFKEMRKSGTLLLRSEFRQNNPKKYRTLGKISYSNQRSGDLKRLWGAEYIREQLEKKLHTENHLYRVPRFVVVIDDDNTHLNVYSGGFGLYKSFFISYFDTQNAEILAENIDNSTPCAKLISHPLLYELGFTDDGDNSNVLEKDGFYYLVDTKPKSFGAIFEKYGKIKNYARKRFVAFAPSGFKIMDVKINIS